MTRARTLADMISDGVIGTTELADDAITPVKLDETGNYTIAQLGVNGTITADGLTVDGDGYFGGSTVGGTDYPLRIQNTDAGIAAGVGIEFSIDGGNDVIGSTIRSDRTGSAYHQSALTFATRRANGSGMVDAAKIDQNGNLLVGKASVDTTTDGLVMRERGQVYATSDGNTPVILNRKTSDGDIVQVRKDNTIVGSIGTGGGRPYFVANNGSNGGGFKVDSTQFYPVDRTGAVSNGVLDLGYSSGRWKDLYLSGGAFLGGTGAANKLSDYEEGSVSGAGNVTGSAGGTVTHANFTSYYTKVGRIVHYHFEFQVTSVSGVSGRIQVALPFSSVDYSAGSLRCYNATFSGIPFLGIDAGSSTVKFSANISGSATGSILSTGYYYGQITYTTSA